MSDDLVKRLRYGIVEHRKRWSGDTHDDMGGSVDYDATTDMMQEAADRIEELEAKLAKADEALEFYADQCEGSPNGCPYEGNMCCQVARAALAELKEKTDE